MRNFLILIIALVTINSCKDREQYKVAYTIAENDLIPEGITYSKTTNSFYISSIYKKKIVKVDAKTGEYSDFNSSELGLQILGMFVDEQRKQLWACGNITDHKKRYSAVIKLDLFTGDVIKRYEQVDTVHSMFNDLVLDKKGNIYFTNSSSQSIFKIDNETDSVIVFYENEEILSPNGITISPDNQYLYIAAGMNGIKILDINKKIFVNTYNPSFNSKGIDGLKFYKNSVIGIQNWVPKPSDRKICRYYLNKNGTDIISNEIIDQDNPYFDVPTTFVMVRNKLFCVANSQLLNFSDNKIKDPKALQDIIILEYKL